jgi:hypothetical protein
VEAIEFIRGYLRSGAQDWGTILAKGRSMGHVAWAMKQARDEMAHSDPPRLITIGGRSVTRWALPSPEAVVDVTDS